MRRLRSSSIKSRGAAFLVLLVCLFGLPAFGQPWDGNGTPNYPYLIYDACDMQQIGADSNYWDAHFLLTDNIDLSGIPNLRIGTSTEPFYGVFDGNDLTISNYSWTALGIDKIGLFGYNYGQIRNLKLDNVSFGDLLADDVGGLVGLNLGTVENCHVLSGYVVGYWRPGGLVGRNKNLVKDCSTACSVAGFARIGGLVGKNEYGTILDSYATGEVWGTSTIGGLVGQNGTNGVISCCYAQGYVHGDSQVGGLVGENLGRIDNCYSSGSVIGDEYRIGGLVGFHRGFAIINCYSVGYVEGNEDVGGLVGLNFSILVGSFWDIQTSNQPESSGGEGKSTQEMKSSDTYVGWSCDSVWTIDEPNDYPRLYWEQKPGEILNDEPNIPGNGTLEEPYLISEPNQLNVIGFYPCYWDKHFKLTRDIDLGEVSLAGFNPIGVPFTGVFDGGGHKISNFSYFSDEKAHIGIFRFIDSQEAMVKNVTLVNPQISDTLAGYVGALVGMLVTGTVYNCQVQDGNVEGYSDVGGLVGYNMGGMISSCAADVIVEGASRVGGITGTNNANVIECFSEGSVSAEQRVGGLVGFNFGNILRSASSSSVWALYGIAGGLVGQNASDYEGPSGKIRDCYALGSVSSSEGVGGLVGSNSSTIEKSFSAGEVSGASEKGGLVGWGNGGSYAKCFWDSDVNPDVNGIGNTTDPNVIGESTANMQTESTFTDAGWDFVGEVINGPNDVWTICEGEDYPRLAWEKYGGGNGTEANPYLIRTSCQMNAIGADSNDWDARFKLMADIDLSAYDGNNFNIIGTGASSPFTGVFDGSGLIIRNLELDVNTSEVGLFGCIGDNGIVQNICLEGIDIKGIHCVGGIAGRNEGVIQNCHVSGTIEGQQACGGITGACIGSPPFYIPEIRNSSFRGQVRGTWGTGGIVGDTDGPEIVKCYAIAEIICEGQCGGIVGHNMGGNLKLCFSKGTITCSQHSAGGLTGITYDHCGIGGDINDCYADVTVNCSRIAGGFSGSAPGQDGQIRNCYCSGEVVYDVNNYEDVGGFIGEEREPEGVFSSYFLESSGPDNGFGEPLSTEQMKQQGSFVGWDFVGEVINGPNDIWDICEGTNYPKFVWQIPAADFVCPDGVNFIDYAFFAKHWLQAIYGDCGEVELTGDGKVNWVDFALFAEYWKLTGCGECGGADFTGDENVDLADLYVFATYWLGFEYAEVDLTNDGQVDLDDLREFTENWLAGF